MKIETAKTVVDVQSELNHPLFDFSIPEAKARIGWMVDHLTPYIEPGS